MKIKRYKEINEYGVSNVERLNKVLKIIKKKGYPFDGKYILINQYIDIVTKNKPIKFPIPWISPPCMVAGHSQ